MPPFDDFMDLRRHERDAGFRVKGGLGVDRDGHLTLNLAGPLFVNSSGEVDIRVGGGLAVATGSPKMLVAAPVSRITGNEVSDTSVAGAVTVSDGLRRLAELLLIAQTDIGALNSLVSAIVSSPIKESGSIALDAGGTTTVPSSQVMSGDRVLVTRTSVSYVVLGELYVTNIVDSTSFDVISEGGVDDKGNINWMVVSP